jgi:regulator of sigma E protease
VSWVIVFAGFIALIILHELGHFTAAKAVGMRVERFSLFFPPLLFKKKIGETEYAIGAIPAGGYVKISGMSPAEDLPDEVRTRAYHAQPPWKRIVVIAAGPAVNLVIAFVVLFIFFAAIGPRGASDTIGTIEKGYPAYGVLHLHDKLVSVDGVTGTPAQLSKQIATHKCAVQPPVKGCRATTPAQVVVERNGHPVKVTLTPIYDPANQKVRLGFGFGDGPREPYGVGEAVSQSASQFWYITRQTASLPVRIINPEQRKQISGIVGVSDVAHQTVATDPGLAVLLLAVVSLSLAIVNLFPFLPLDGGHIFWAVVEKVRQRPVPYSVMERAGVVGFMLVILLFIIGFTNDIDKLTNGGFKTR